MVCLCIVSNIVGRRVDGIGIRRHRGKMLVGTCLNITFDDPVDQF